MPASIRIIKIVKDKVGPDKDVSDAEIAFWYYYYTFIRKKPM
jgi:hypothetical protein